MHQFPIISQLREGKIYNLHILSCKLHGDMLMTVINVTEKMHYYFIHYFHI
jgi:hypothetical protein